MRKKENKQEIESNFNRNENFNITNVPKHFNSVTNRGIKKLKQSAIEKIEKDMKFEPGTLQMALKSVDGQFEEAYSTLEGDYSARLTALRNAYSDGISDLRKAFKQYQLQVAEHNIAFDNYSEANRVINGKLLPNNLRIDDEEIESLGKSISNLDRRKK